MSVEVPIKYSVKRCLDPAVAFHSYLQRTASYYTVSSELSVCMDSLTHDRGAGGYCKEYVKGSRPVGIMLDDTWFLRQANIDAYIPTSLTVYFAQRITMPTAEDGKASDLPIMKWERRKRPSTAFAPSLRSGCTMTLWANKQTGILFGGVTDEDTSEETMESMFHNDL